MSQTITITIDGRPCTLTRRDIQTLIGISRDIDRESSVEKIRKFGPVSIQEQRRTLARLGKWLDTHGPEGGTT